MCGIAAIFNIKGNPGDFRDTALSMARKIRHRGPDWSGIHVGKSAVLAHERLSIVDPASGGQPLFSPDRRQVLAVNGEIYNHLEIRERYAGRYSFATEKRLRGHPGSLQGEGSLVPRRPQRDFCIRTL